MKVFKIMMLSLMISGMVFSAAYAKHHLPEERGKTLFNDPKAFGGKKSCNECHPDGRGLKNSAAKKEFHIMGKNQKSLEEAVNFCIVNANMGKAIDKNSDEMKDMVAYLKTLKGKKTEKKTPGY